MKEQEEKMVLMDQQRIERTLKRMAHQVVEDVGEGHDLHIVGIQHRGLIIAEQLAGMLSDIYGERLSCSSLDVKGTHEEEGSSFDPSSIAYDDSYILVVDDVIFSGSTMFQAFQMIVDDTLPQHLHCAVLIDRGHRQLPVESKYIGMSIPTKLNEHVALEVSSNDELKGVNLFF